MATLSQGWGMMSTRRASLGSAANGEWRMAEPRNQQLSHSHSRQWPVAEVSRQGSGRGLGEQPFENWRVFRSRRGSGNPLRLAFGSAPPPRRGGGFSRTSAPGVVPWAAWAAGTVAPSARLRLAPPPSEWGRLDTFFTFRRVLPLPFRWGGVGGWATMPALLAASLPSRGAETAFWRIANRGSRIANGLPPPLGLASRLPHAPLAPQPCRGVSSAGTVAPSARLRLAPPPSEWGRQEMPAPKVAPPTTRGVDRASGWRLGIGAKPGPYHPRS